MTPAEKYRKKPVVIDAFQFTEGVALAHFIGEKPLPFSLSASGRYHPKDRRVDSAYINIKTLEGVMRCGLGDWVIRGIKGELYPCKPDIFEATYEKDTP